MIATTDQYYDRMASAIGDKSKLLAYLPEITSDYRPHILDVGGGGGELSEVLLELGYRVTAVDRDPIRLARLTPRYPHFRLVRTDAEYVDQLGEEFDAVICSSVLHEVFSYHGRMPAVYRTLRAIHAALKPGGTLLIRDGVMPDNAGERGFVDILSGLDKPVTSYLEIMPFPSRIKLTRVEKALWAGNYASLMEFAFTYNWGEENYEREARELYGLATLNEYAIHVENVGFECIHKEAYVQEGYVTGLHQKVMLLDKNMVELPMFNTNAIWIYRKEQ
jgi:SAM-dependent methyltransferase